MLAARCSRSGGRAAIYAAAFAAHGLTVATEVMAGAMARAHAALLREIDGHPLRRCLVSRIHRARGAATGLRGLLDRSPDRLFAELPTLPHSKSFRM
ncbi:MAG: hypothetical protein U1E76_23940 [Planctomycetota bacterium]